LNTATGQTFYKNTDLGVFGGTSYYTGDINPRTPFYAPGIALGALIKHNFNEHHALRATLYYGQLKGNDLDFKNDFQQNRASEFKLSLLDFHIGYEFNFLPYITNRTESAHSPYIFAGVGYSFNLTSTVRDAASGQFAIPFGIGYKYSINPAVGVGCEWGLRKTFTDDLDGITNPGTGTNGTHSVLHNNDWYSFVGIFVTFRIFEESFSCPAYKQPFGFK
jgi:hypothetical protein